MKNEYVEELMKFNGEKVIVTDTEGNEHKGVCKAMSHSHLNIVLMTDKEKILIKNIRHVRRQRSWKGEEKEEVSECVL